MSNDSELLARLNGETGRVAWTELERHFARGALVTVARGEDLVAVAASFIEDDRDAVARRMADGRVQRTTDDEAARWADGDAELWAVVVAPWVLVQEAG